MSKLKYFFSNQFEKLGGTIKRFYLPFSLIISLFIVTSCVTLWTLDDTTIKILFKLIYTIAFGVFTCTLAKIIYEKHFRSKFSETIVDIISLALSAIPYIFLHFYENNIFVILALSGIAISEIIFILYFSKTDSMSETFSYYLKNILFNFFACTIIFSGISICILAFTTLIYDFKDSYKAYSILSEFVGMVLFGSMFLSIIPKSGQKITIPKVFKTIVSKIMLPVYIILLSILYMYLGKILFTWTFPSGQVNWFVSFSSLLFVFFAFSLSQYKNENKVMNLFLKFGGLAIIPTIAMQFVAIYIRVSNYGLTIPRYASIVLNIFALIFTIMFLFKREKSLKHSLLVFAGFVLLTTATPLNIIDIPMREQSHRLKTLLLNNDMLVDNKIVPNAGISGEEKIKIIESYQYVKGGFENANYKPEFLNKVLIHKPEKEIFGFEKTYQHGESVYKTNIYFNYNYDFINISNYSKLYDLPNSNALAVENGEIILKSPLDKKQVVKGLYDYLKSLYLKYKGLGKDSVDTEKIEYEFSGGKLILSSITLYQDEKEVLNIGYHSECYLLEK